MRSFWSWLDNLMQPVVANNKPSYHIYDMKPYQHVYFALRNSKDWQCKLYNDEDWSDKPTSGFYTVYHDGWHFAWHCGKLCISASYY